MSVRQEHRYQKLVIEEGRVKTDLQRLFEAAYMERKPMKPSIPPAPYSTRREVRRWMRMNIEDYENETELAEGANAALNLPDNALDDETHWIWDEAFLAFEWKDAV